MILGYSFLGGWGWQKTPVCVRTGGGEKRGADEPEETRPAESWEREVGAGRFWTFPRCPFCLPCVGQWGQESAGANVPLSRSLRRSAAGALCHQRGGGEGGGGEGRRRSGRLLFLLRWPKSGRRGASRAFYSPIVCPATARWGILFHFKAITRFLVFLVFFFFKAFGRTLKCRSPNGKTKLYFKLKKKKKENLRFTFAFPQHRRGKSG